jgi:XTP/dITP diphosphohydrolase
MILEKLKDVPKEQRSARFVCAMALAVPEREVVTTLATMEGEIGYESRGENGFGYDPIFYLPQYEKSSAEISPEQKNEISHRGKALRLMKEKIKEMQDEATEKDAL